MKALKSPALQIGIGAVAGIVFGLAVGEWAANLKFVGDIFIRLIQMSIVPLVMASVIVATGGDVRDGRGQAGRPDLRVDDRVLHRRRVLAWGSAR